jgi:hypothetical protein
LGGDEAFIHAENDSSSSLVSRHGALRRTKPVVEACGPVVFAAAPCRGRRTVPGTPARLFGASPAKYRPWQLTQKNQPGCMYSPWPMFELMISVA